MPGQNWWDGLQPALDPEKITVGMMADLARRGTLESVIRMIGLEVEAPDGESVDTMANLTLVIAQQQRPDVTFEDVLAMPFVAMARLLGLQEPPPPDQGVVAVQPPPAPLAPPQRFAAPLSTDLREAAPSVA